MPEEIRRDYELVTILSPQLEGESLGNVKKEIEGIINRAEGSIDFKEEKKHNLAYPINKQGQGIYLISQVSILPEKVADISKELKLNKQVLRHLISQLPAIKPEVEKAKAKKILKKLKATTKPSYTPKRTTEGELEEIDKKLDKIIEEI